MKHSNIDKSGLAGIIKTRKHCSTNLQNQSRGSAPVLGGFDSHALPPVIARAPVFGVDIDVY